MGWGREESELGPLVHELEALLPLHLFPIDSISVVALKNEQMNYTPAGPTKEQFCGKVLADKGTYFLNVIVNYVLVIAKPKTN